MSLPLITRDNFLTLAKLLQWLNRNFLEKYDVVVAVILQSKPSFVGTRPALRFEIELLVGHGLSLGIVRDFYAIQFDDGVRAIERDDHSVPLGAGLTGKGQGFGEGVKCSGDVILVLVGSFGVVVDLDFVAVVNGHPGFARLDGDTNEPAGIVVIFTHAINNLDAPTPPFPAGPIEKAHS